MLGDWAFAIWDSKQQHLFLARDHFGNSGLYYYHSDQIFAFASTMKGLLQQPQVPVELNLSALAANWLGLAGDVTFYQNIHRLPPAHAMLVTRDRIEGWRYWHPQEAPAVRYPRDEDYLDVFTDLYRQAVGDRLPANGQTGILLSSGLDSSSVAALAAPALTKRGKRLIAFSAVPQYDPASVILPARCGDESPWVKAIGQRYPNIDIRFINTADVSPIAALHRSLEILAEPVHGAGNMSWALASFEAAASQGITTLLSGWGGNFTISFNGDRSAYLRALQKHGDWRRWGSEIIAWQRQQHASIFQTIKSQVVKPLLPASWADRYRARNHQEHTFVRRERLRSLLQADTSFTSVQKPGNEYNGLFKYFRTGKAQAASAAFGIAFGLQITDPPVDKRIIEFCLGLPQEQFTRNGQERLLVRLAMKGKLPHNVLWQGCRGLQSADIACRVRDHYDEAAAVLDSFDRSPLVQEYLDVPRMDTALKQLQTPLDWSVTQQTFALLKGMMQGLLLLRAENGTL